MTGQGSIVSSRFPDDVSRWRLSNGEVKTVLYTHKAVDGERVAIDLVIIRRPRVTLKLIRSSLRAEICSKARRTGMRFGFRNNHRLVSKVVF